MAGRGQPPKPTAQRRRRNAPLRGDWHAAPGIGWQHGPVPSPPARLLKASREAWVTWFGAWYAAHWRPEDLPALRQLVRLFDQVERAPAKAELTTQLRYAEETWGITPKGQQDRHWLPPENEAPGDSPPAEGETAAASRYGHLRSIG
jgi:hypothetical protein